MRANMIIDDGRETLFIRMTQPEYDDLQRVVTQDELGGVQYHSLADMPHMLAVMEALQFASARVSAADRQQLTAAADGWFDHTLQGELRVSCVAVRIIVRGRRRLPFFGMGSWFGRGADTVIELRPDPSTA